MNQRTSRKPLLLCAGVLTLWMSGCSAGDESVSSTPPTAKDPVATQAFSKPLVAAKDDGKTASRVAGLLQSTDPTERARQVQAGINSKTGKDPFSSIPPIVSFKVPITSTNSPNSPTPTAPASAPSTPTPLPAPTPLGQLPTTSKPGSAIAALPPLPEPTLAKSVEVTGVVVVRGVPQAIVKAPNEATSRYVQVGQRLSNGQILVKRIEMNNGSDPVVILEQGGVEVARTVGSPATSSGSPTAMTLRQFLFG